MALRDSGRCRGHRVQSDASLACVTAFRAKPWITASCVNELAPGSLAGPERCSQPDAAEIHLSASNGPTPSAAEGGGRRRSVRS